MVQIEKFDVDLSELSHVEKSEIIGGNIWIRALGGAIAVYDAASDFIDGFRQGWNEAKNSR